MMDDQSIVQLFFERSERALAELDAKYGKLCHTLSRNILNSRQDAEECVNDAYLGVWNTVPPARPDPLRAYLCKIVRNVSLKLYHRKKAEKRNSAYDVAMQELEDCLPAAESVEDAVASRELSRAIDRWLDGLAPTDQEAFLWRYWYGQQVAEVARQAGCSPNTMTKRLGRLRESLRRALEQEGISV